MKRLALPLSPGLALGLVLALAACGSQGPLQWPQGGPPPPAFGEEETPTPEAMLEPPPQAAPLRIDDVVRNSEERAEDPFDLPPN
ncbi:hypothetical protein ACSMXM_15235 [Pacificimonas sp. ICDLI1SI03]|jgi:predicted small lipoprotein YifL|tara:strand:+ start:9209 stop:9463 length:255 start_codon:yes stop_codon:yes gene_type:complete